MILLEPLLCCSLSRQYLRHQNLHQQTNHRQKRSRFKTAVEDFWSSWKQQHNNEACSTTTTTTAAENELTCFLAEPCASRDTDPVQWWKVNATRFPTISQTAKRYLTAPPTSVHSERLFSTAGCTLSDNISCLGADNMERLVFLKANNTYF